MSRFVLAPGDARVTPPKKKKSTSLQLTLKHLPGRHVQAAHGRGWNGGRGRQRDEVGRFTQGGRAASVAGSKKPKPSSAGDPSNEEVRVGSWVDALNGVFQGEIVSMDEDQAVIREVDGNETTLSLRFANLKPATRPAGGGAPSRNWNGEGPPAVGQRVHFNGEGDGEVVRTYVSFREDMLHIKLDDGRERFSSANELERLSPPRGDKPDGSASPPGEGDEDDTLRVDDRPPLKGDGAYESVPVLQNSDHRGAFVSYQETDHTAVNNWLRFDHRHPDQRFADRAERVVKNLDEAFREAPPLERAIVVHRGVSNIEEIMGPPRQRVGQAFVDKGLISTSAETSVVKERFSGDAEIEIVIPAGYKAIRSHYGAIQGLDEKEILLPRGTRFRIVEDELEDDPNSSWSDPQEIRVVKLEVVGQ